jgi:hypothetical protein
LVSVLTRIVVSFDVDQSINHEALNDEESGADGKVDKKKSFFCQGFNFIKTFILLFFR